MSQNNRFFREVGLIAVSITAVELLKFTYKLYNNVETRKYYKDKLSNLFGYKTQDTQHKEDEFTTVVNIVNTSNNDNDISHAYGH